MGLTPPVRLGPNDPVLAQVLDLLRAAFAYMDGRIDPLSSLHLVGLDEIRALARESEVWSIGRPPVACMILTVKTDALYLGKLCVAACQRRRGLARHLIAHAEKRCRALGLDALELQTRVELVENHASFSRLGFVETGKTAHPGFDRPTSITMRRQIRAT